MPTTSIKKADLATTATPKKATAPRRIKAPATVTAVAFGLMPDPDFTPGSTQAGPDSAAPHASVAAGPDADLLRLCGEIADLNAHLARLPDDVDDDALEDRRYALQDRLVLLRPVTMAGVVAKAGIVLAAIRSRVKDAWLTEPGGLHEEMAFRFLSDLAATSEAALPGFGGYVLPKVDAELIQTAAEVLKLKAMTVDVLTAASSDQGGDDAVYDRLRPDFDRLDSLLEVVCTWPGLTAEGIEAKARVALNWLPENALSSDPQRDPHLRLTASVFRDVLGVNGEPQPSPDAALLTLRPEYERLRAEYDRCNVEDVAWSDVEASGEAFDKVCVKIVEMPPAVTAEGRAFKAIAVMHQLHYACDESMGTGPRAAFALLRELVGTAFPLPG